MKPSERISQILEEMGYKNVLIIPCLGFWRRQDVYRWEAQGDKDGFTFSIGCWETMTEAARRGFTLYKVDSDPFCCLEVCVNPKEV